MSKLRASVDRSIALGPQFVLHSPSTALSSQLRDAYVATLILVEPMINTPGQVEITFQYSRHVGPRFIQAGVTLQFDSTRPYSFNSQVTWPPEENYERAVREAVEEVLKERLGSLKEVAVVLKAINFHPVDSSESGFRRAARAATEASFDV